MIKSPNETNQMEEREKAYQNGKRGIRYPIWHPYYKQNEMGYRGYYVMNVNVRSIKDFD